ncbi:hypothetical protein JTB14_017779 [Gonioctena quinquepunctata]|nr:hypothetical protein JTB14_017779 [Gonioctena quinquepunctata]
MGSTDHEEASLDDEVPYRQALKGTLDYGLLYRAEFKFKELEAYCDAYYGGDLKTRRSRTSIVCEYSDGAIPWASQKRKSVVLSKTEAEYVAASEEYQEGVIKIEHIDGQKQIADIMTKHSPCIRFERLRNSLGVIRLEED